MISGLREALSEALDFAGLSPTIHSMTALGGGDINHAAKLTSATGTYFVKWNEQPPPDFIESETRGLKRLREAKILKVPSVVASGLVRGTTTEFLILEYIEPGPKQDVAAERLGTQLAQMHSSQRAKISGFDQPNYLGSLPQPNPPNRSWLAFFRDYRLGCQRELAISNERLPPNRAKALDDVINHLDRWIDEDQVQPALLHGDLWGENWMSTTDAIPVLIDPAVAYGDSEMDLAMTRLFGGFPPVFYDAYREVKPDLPGHVDRLPLYQLYYLLAHLNLFGEQYGASVDQLLAQLR